MECLDANAVQDLMSGALDASARGVAVAHLDGCEDCRALVALLARDVSRGATAIGTPTGEPVRIADLQVVEPRAFGGLVPQGTPRTAEVSLILQSGTRQVGKTFGRYTLVDRIGAGAMGVVYKAEDPGLSRLVALKLLHKPDAALTDRLIREARAMAQVNHPNVVQVYDAGVSDGSTYIAMELVTGESLRAWQQGKRTIAEIIERYIDAGRGLAAAHDAGIVHRDFKPDNVLVGGDGRVRVTDFGLSSARRSTSGDGAPVGPIELTQSGIVLGTPAYMAPEQFTGGNLDPRTDQFNFCVALYEALYGQRPFAGKTFEELGDHVCDGKVRPPPPGVRVSRELREILLRGLSVRPGDRFPTMGHLLDELGRDRARRWRFSAIVSATLAVALGLGLGADFVVRDRVSAENNQSFAATGVQIERAFQLFAQRFVTNTNQMYHQAAIRAVTNYRDQFDFGLRSEEEDAEERSLIRQQLESQDWSLWQMDTQSELTIGIADYKGRLLYTNARGARAEEYFGSELTKIGWLKDSLAAGREKTMLLQPTDDPALKDSRLLGPEPRYHLAFLFARTLFLGSGTAKEQSGTLVQALDASELAKAIRLDQKMQLAIVAPSRVAATDADSSHPDQRVPDELIDAALASDEVIEVEYRGVPYQVKSQPLNFGGHRLGHVVMVRELGGVLSGVFPAARLILTTTAMLALAFAIATAFQARRLTRG